MYWHSTDYKAQGGDVRGALVNRGFWAHLPRLTLACRLTGHVPVVDGTSGFNGRPGSRWVCCDRCGIRPDPQGSLSPAQWGIGDRIDMEADAEAFGVKAPPGDWPAHPEGVIGGQLIIGGHVTAGIGVKVGNAGSEHVLAANACLPFLGGLYLHTEGFGTGIQRRLNPVGYESKVISLGASDGRLHWQLWAKRDSHDRDTPRWRDGSIRIDPRDILLGERRYSYTDVAEGSPVPLLMPDGTMHQLAMRLRRQSHGRRHGRKRESWTVDCDCREGIPYRNDGRDGLNGWSVAVGDTAVGQGAWQREAVAASIVKITGMRIQYEWKPEDARAA
jgi:hypothetical protein